jgi:hypothetical protein
MIPRVGADLQALAKARLALQGEAKGVTALIEAVPKSTGPTMPASPMTVSSGG